MDVTEHLASLSTREATLDVMGRSGALISLAMLALGGYRPDLPGRSPA